MADFKNYLIPAIESIQSIGAINIWGYGDVFVFSKAEQNLRKTLENETIEIPFQNK